MTPHERYKDQPNNQMDLNLLDLSTLAVTDVLAYTNRVRGIEDPRTLPTGKLPSLLVLCQKLLGYCVVCLLVKIKCMLCLVFVVE